MTRSSTDLLGTVFFRFDYNLPIEEFRQEFLRFVEKSPLWDTKVATLVMTDADQQTIEVRALISARTAAHAFDLRCAVREHLIAFVQKKFPKSLPRYRAIFEQSHSVETSKQSE
jgi:hypothetical protein